MAGMTAGETWDFLMAGTRTGHVATVQADGRPHVKPVWFELSGKPGDFEVLFTNFTTAADTVAGRNLTRDGRVMICVDDPVPPFSFMLIEGTAVLSEDSAELLAVATRLGARYMGADRAAEYGTRNAVPGELIVRVSPARVLAQRDIAD
jgi:PPOX class probable F420-dependent enzyme